MIKIELTGGRVTAVDDEDADLAAREWCVCTAHSKAVHKFYASSSRGLMHRLILGRKLGRPLTDTEFVDHVDGDGLNNTRDNLRLASRTENAANRGKSKTNTSGFKGVKFHKKTGKWTASIGGKDRRYIGLFATKEEAAAAYDGAALSTYGTFAQTNLGAAVAVALPLSPGPGKNRANKTGFRGVYFCAGRNKFRASIQANSRSQHLGFFDSVINAALAFDKAFYETFGDREGANFGRFACGLGEA